MNKEAMLEATSLGVGRYYVRPAGQLGTMGWSPQRWQGRYVKARSAKQAIAVISLEDIFGPAKIQLDNTSAIE